MVGGGGGSARREIGRVWPGARAPDRGRAKVLLLLWWKTRLVATLWLVICISVFAGCWRSCLGLPCLRHP